MTEVTSTKAANILKVIKASPEDANRIKLRASDYAEAAVWVPGLAPRLP